MHIGRHIVQELVLELGDPVVERWDVPVAEAEFRTVEKHLDSGRSHDVSLFIRKDDDVAVVIAQGRGYPEGAYLIPSGGIHPEESFLDGAAREAFAQTGLEIRVEDYLLQIHASYTWDGGKASWTTHVMQARSEGGAIRASDGSEVESARWINLSELGSKVNPILLDSGSGELRYRARIHERLVELTSKDSISA